MDFFGRKGHVASVGINEKAPLTRRVERAKRVKEAMERTEDKDRLKKLRAEFDQLTDSLLSEKAEIEELLRLK